MGVGFFNFPKVLSVLPGEILQNANVSNGGITSATPIKVKETKITGMGGIVRVRFNLTGAIYPTNGRIYVNGVAKGTIRAKAGEDYTMTTYTEDIPYTAGDFIQLYGWNGAGGGYGLLANFNFYTAVLLPDFVNLS